MRMASSRPPITPARGITSSPFMSTMRIAHNQLYYGHMESQAVLNHLIPERDSGTNLDAVGLAAHDNIYRLQNLSVKSVTRFGIAEYPRFTAAWGANPENTHYVLETLAQNFTAPSPWLSLPWYNVTYRVPSPNTYHTTIYSSDIYGNSAES
jgi:hypothetical protein